MNEVIRSLCKFVNDFKNRGGYHVFVSTLISKFTSILTSMFIVRLMTAEQYGEITFIVSFISFFVPFNGLGLNFSLLRYGSIEERTQNKRSLYFICLKYGSLFSILLISTAILVARVLDFDIIQNGLLLIIFSFYLITHYLMELSQSYLRINNNNVGFATNNIIFSIVLLILIFSGTYFFGGTGYMLSRIITPLIIFLIVMFREKLFFNLNTTATKATVKKYINYGIFVGLGSIASQMLYQIDTILLGVLTPNASIVAEYKVATIIPFAILFIPSVIMTTDFVTIAKNYNKKMFLISYRKKIMLVLFVVSFLGAIFSFIFANDILGFLYGSEYSQASKLMNILMIGIIGTFTFNVPNGNILSAVGKSKWNAFLSYFSMAFNFILSYFFIKIIGIYGAAVSTTIVMWVTSLLSYMLCNYYLKTLE